jgi:hypothetical protein
MAYSVEEGMSIVKTFYQTNSFVAVQRQFRSEFNAQQAPAISAIDRLVQKFEKTDSVCNNKIGAMGRHRSARTQDNVARTCEVLLRIRENL